MISLYTGYSFKNKLGGVISWSGALPLIKREDISNEKKDLNVFFGYGDNDTIITPEYFIRLRLFESPIFLFMAIMSL